jgi:hypothetical protein
MRIAISTIRTTLTLSTIVTTQLKGSMFVTDITVGKRREMSACVTNITYAMTVGDGPDE